MFCNHNWEKIHDETTESKLEHLMNIDYFPKNSNVYMTRRKKIIILKCTRCGKLNKTIVEI